MPLLNRGGAGFGRAIPTQAPFGEVDTSQPVGAAMKTGLFEACANLNCRTGWLHLWRNRSVPVFENGWTCSPACTAVRVTAAVNRELDGRGYAGESHRHRIPLGLVMLEQGWITQTQLRRALEAQKAARTGRLGEWLVRQRAVSEATVTRALGLQWSCPVLPLELHDAAAMTVAMPRLFVDAFGALPLRLAGGRVLYLGFEERLDPVLALSTERMTGLQVECGIRPHPGCKVPRSGTGRGRLRTCRSPCPGQVGGADAPYRLPPGEGARLPVAAHVAQSPDRPAA